MKKRVLVVDNTDNARASLERLLRDASYETVSTWSGREALEMVESHKIDILLVDEYVADLHIGELLKRIARLAAPPRVLIMQLKPMQNTIRFEGSTKAWQIIDKTQIVDVMGSASARVATE